MFGFKVPNILLIRCKEILSYIEAFQPQLANYFKNIMSWYEDRLDEFENYIIEVFEEELKKEGIQFVIETENKHTVIYKFIYK